MRNLWKSGDPLWSLKKIYFATAFLILFLSVINFSLYTYYIKSYHDMENYLFYVGKERSLVMESGMLASELVQAPMAQKKAFSKQLQTAITEIENRHFSLIQKKMPLSHTLPSLPPQFLNVYQHNNIALDKQVTQYLVQVKALVQDSPAAQTPQNPNYLSIQNALLNQKLTNSLNLWLESYRQILIQNANVLFWINILTFSGILLLLVFLSFFLFLPIFRKILKDTDCLKEANFKLADALNERIYFEANLKESEQSKELFYATLAHDLTTPIRAEHRVLEMLYSGQLGELNAQQKQMMGEMIKSNRFKYHVIDNLLTTYKYKTGLVELQKSPTNLNEIIQHLLSHELAALVDEKQHEINLDLYSNLTPFLSDPFEIERVLRNLMQNAIHYTPRNGHIDVITAYHDDTTVRVTIKDDGPGIEPERQKQLFSPFRTDAKKFKQIGSSLGLYLCRQIIESHGGELTLDSHEGAGCVVTFMIPFEQFVPQSMPLVSLAI
jgi:signal transduction histidine kinase